MARLLFVAGIYKYNNSHLDYLARWINTIPKYYETTLLPVRDSQGHCTHKCNIFFFNIFIFHCVGQNFNSVLVLSRHARKTKIPQVDAVFVTENNKMVVTQARYKLSEHNVLCDTFLLKQQKKIAKWKQYLSKQIILFSNRISVVVNYIFSFYL